MQAVLDAPVALDPGCHRLGLGLLGGEGADQVDDLAGALLAGRAGSGALSGGRVRLIWRTWTAPGKSIQVVACTARRVLRTVRP